MGPFQATVELSSHSPDDTQRIGRAIGGNALPGDIYLLTGELGAGKTCLVQGIAQGLGVREHAMSPSFVLVREYCGRLPLYHMDFYRLKGGGEVADLGLDDYLYGKGVSVIEWADRGLEEMPPEHMLIEIQYINDNERILAVCARGDRYTKMLRDLETATGH